MNRDEILTRLIKEGHNTLEELRVLDNNPTPVISVPYLAPVPIPQYPQPYLQPYFYGNPPTINCNVNSPGTCGTTFDVNIKQEYFAGVDTVLNDTGDIEIHTYKVLWRQVPTGRDLDKLLIIKPKPNES